MNHMFTWPRVRIAIVIGLALRLIAAIFSQGYAMHDDHFVIEDGPMRWLLVDYGGWFSRSVPPGHSVVYPSILFAIISSCVGIGITDPQQQMLVVRVLHALVATLAIPLGASIARRLGTEESARSAAFLIAVLWVLPFLSVRCLIEVVCIPPLMAGVFLVIRRSSPRDLVLAGLAFAGAFMFRYQTALLPIVFVGVLAAQRQWRNAGILALACLFFVSVTQGLVDLFVWGSFMAAPIEYLRGSMFSADDYVNGHWWMYMLLLIGILIPPTSVMLLWKMISDKRPTLRYELVLPLVIFTIAHSLVANRQERFLIPIVPLVVVALAVAWTGRQNISYIRWTQAAWGWFWVGNTALLVLFTFSYSKRSRVESLTVLSHQQNVERVVVVTRPGVFVPTFYLYPHVPLLVVSTDTTSSTWTDLAAFHPTHVVFYDNASFVEMHARVVRATGHQLQTIASIEPGLLDATLHYVNPLGNKNEVATVCEIVASN